MSLPRIRIRPLALVIPIGLVVLSFGSSRAQRGEDALAVGDSLPFLQVEEWLQGDPIRGWQPGQFYLIDLWAAWCTPCLASIPLLESLQERFADDALIVIGITSQDRWGNNLEAVKEFLESRESRVTYRMAWLTPSRSEERDLEGIFVHDWMQRLGTTSLPKAFLVDGSGRLVWVGNPHVVEPRVQALVTGGFDMTRARREFHGAQASRALRERVDEAIAARNWESATAMARELLDKYSDVADPKLFTGLAAEVIESGAPSSSLLDVAVRAAQQAVRATRFEAPGHLDGLASALAARGDLVGAALAEMRAIEMSEGKMKVEQQKKLAGYLQKLHPDSAGLEPGARRIR